ncbi:pentapeptide repeat-containing protein [Leptolyngbya ohadii]|uniref:pentapeptide repeat-containing protein n=1 Tax=Leptolyngbya ohadii TaxID=1962290 RepID=UPI000B59C7EE|nr:pentapeptide repeat-containing protein [Leptolyngbya ohadii]
MVEANDIAVGYEQGKRDFCKLDLRGYDFQHYDFTGSDFSQADLRGCNFQQAILRNVNFTGAKIGLRPRAAILLGLGLLLLVVLLGITAGLMGTIVNLNIRVHTNRFEEVLAGWTMVLLLGGYAIVSTQRGLRAGFTIFAIAFLLSISVVLAAPIIAQIMHSFAFSVAFAIANAITITATVLTATVVAIVLATGAGVALGWRISLLVAFGFGAGFFAMVAVTQIVAAIAAVVPSIMMLTAYQCWRALKGDGRHPLIRSAVIFLASRWGTSFEAADLTDANFTGTRLQSANFENAILTRTRWSNGVPTEVLHLFVDSFTSLG